MAKNSLDNYCRHCHDLNGAFHNPAGHLVSRKIIAR